MANKKIQLKIGRNLKIIDKYDLILDNGIRLQVTAHKDSFKSWYWASIPMSRRQFKNLESSGFVYLDKKKTTETNQETGGTTFTYYRFDINKMLECGYKEYNEIDIN